MKKTIVIGAGAAGLMAAVSASDRGEEVLVLEKNEKAGKKIYITGKGRCNVTNACDPGTFQKNITNGSKFMISPLRAFGPEEMIAFLSENNCRTKTERGNRVFPVTDHASDITKAFLHALSERKVELRLHTEVTGIEKTSEGFTVTARSEGKKVRYGSDKVIVCTGGLSYPVTGSTGDGYRFAETFGHTVNKTAPALVSVLTKEDISALAGTSLVNTGLHVRKKTEDGTQGKELFSEVGELTFTHRGISGPMVLTVSSLFSHELAQGTEFLFSVDLKPGLSREELDKRILRDFEKAKNTQIFDALSGLLLRTLRTEVLRRSGIEETRPVHDITRAEREKLVKNIKCFDFISAGTGGYEEAVITAGGISLKEINPKNMESKIVPGLYFAGEVLDVDALTGGFNLQIAFSTGFVSGREEKKS